MKGLKWNWHSKEAREAFNKMRTEDAERSRKLHEEYLKREEAKEKELERQRNEGLALFMLLGAIGNEQAMNDICDTIKDLELVEDYK